MLKFIKAGRVSKAAAALAAVSLLAVGAAQAQTAYTGAWRMIASLTGTVGTATGTSEQTLATYTLPGNTMVNAGQRLRISAAFSKAANVDSVTCKLYFGSEVVSTGANTTSGAGMRLVLDVVKTGAKAQVVTGFGQAGTTVVTPYSAAGSEDDTASAGIVVKATCTDGTSAANDAVLQDFRVDAAL